MTSATNSIGFVITAIYTGTFANAVYQIVEFDEKLVTLQLRTEVDPTILLCATMCMVMALRFFFGNNNFIDEVFAKPRSAGDRLYHFSVTVIQSLVLLGSSYLIRNPREFTKWLIILFALEVIWYVGCLLFLRAAISGEGNRLNQSLLLNETANAVLVFDAVLAFYKTRHDPSALVFVVGCLFVANTAVDLRVNLKAYMGN